MQSLIDAHARQFEVLRLSITDSCNFRCQYCLPNGYQRPKGHPGFLALHEIENLVRGFVRLGFWKIRLTGGEPTLRRDFLEIVHTVSAISGVKTLALSTNGHMLAKNAKAYRLAGISRVNISIDSLDRARFHALTGVDRLNDVLAGVEAALEACFESVKLNAVLAQSQEDSEAELERFVEWVKDRPVTLRLIELMQTGKNEPLFRTRHHSSGALRKKLIARGWVLRPREPGDGPAEEFSHPMAVGRIGFIAPYGGGFCETCNRLRVSSVGGLRLCLFGERDHDLRPLLQSSSQIDALCDRVRELILGKPKSHYLKDGIYGQTRSFSEIGG